MNPNFRTATHEAAHAVTCCFLLGKMKGCVVFDSGGGICIDKPADAKVEMLTDVLPAKQGAILYGRRDVSTRDLLNECIMYAAGYVAAELLLGEPGATLYEDNGDSRTIAANFLGCYPDASEDEQIAFLSLVNVMTRPIIRKYEKYIRLVAAELSQKKILTADEVVVAMFPGRVTLT